MDKTAINEIISYLKNSLSQCGIQVDGLALFGSALSGNMDKESDIDIIIISPEFENLDIFERAKITMKPETETMKKFKVPMDIISLTPAEFEESNFKSFYQAKIIA